MWPKDLLIFERITMRSGLLTMALVLLSGLVIFMVGGHSVWRQVVILLHIITGLGITLVCLPYIPVHFKRTAFFRRPTLILTGLLLVACLLVLVSTGLVAVIRGNRESDIITMPAHLIASGILVLLLVGHMLDHYFRMPQRRKDQSATRFLSFDRAVRPVFLTGIFMSVLCVLVMHLLFSSSNIVEPVDPVVANYERPYGDHPFRPSQTETSHGGFVKPQQIGDSESCIE